MSAPLRYFRFEFQRVSRSVGVLRELRPNGDGPARILDLAKDEAIAALQLIATGRPDGAVLARAALARIAKIERQK